MKNKTTTSIIQIETYVNGICLKGELEYWAKEYTVRLKEPFKAETKAHLIYFAPVKYVYEKLEKSTYKEIELKEKSKEILRELYLKHK